LFARGSWVAWANLFARGSDGRVWIPAFAGMTGFGFRRNDVSRHRFWIPALAGMTPHLIPGVNQH
jgi:hypothetical protein